MKKQTEITITTSMIAFAFGFIVTEIVMNSQYKLIVPAVALLIAAPFHFRTHFYNYDRNIRDDHSEN